MIEESKNCKMTREKPRRPTLECCATDSRVKTTQEPSSAQFQEKNSIKIYSGSFWAIKEKHNGTFCCGKKESLGNDKSEKVEN